MYFMLDSGTKDVSRTGSSNLGEKISSQFRDAVFKGQTRDEVQTPGPQQVQAPYKADHPVQSTVHKNKNISNGFNEFGSILVKYRCANCGEVASFRTLNNGQIVYLSDKCWRCGGFNWIQLPFRNSPDRVLPTTVSSDFGSNSYGSRRHSRSYNR